MTPTPSTMTQSDDQSDWSDVYVQKLKWCYQAMDPSPYPLVFPPDNKFQAAMSGGRNSNWERFCKYRGTRYVAARLANYEVAHDKQQTALDALVKYCSEIRNKWLGGSGVVLYGSKGTGKDHLMMGVARFAFGQCQWVTWINGTDLFAKFRDSFDSNTSEDSLVCRYSRCPVLWISDPIPAAGKLTDYQSAVLFSIIDSRYRENLPTWITVNAANASEFEERILPQNADRLRDGALAIHCNWPSYRKTAESLK